MSEVLFKKWGKAVVALGLVLCTLIYLGFGYFSKKQTVNPIKITDGEVTSSDADPVSETSSSVAVKQIYVDISGGVVKPGLYQLPDNSRIADLIKEAGGMSKYVDALWVAQQLNLSQKLKDADKIYIPLQTDREERYTSTKIDLICQNMTSSVVESSTDGDSQSSSETKLNVNSASKAQLVDLPGIGEVTADKIIAGRPYTSLDDFYTKAAIGSSTQSKIESLITVE